MASRADSRAATQSNVDPIESAQSAQSAQLAQSNQSVQSEQSAQDEVFLFPASSAQQRLWVLAQLAPDNPFYNMPAAIRLTGDLNVTALARSFNEIVCRHETLRTTFAWVEGQLMQVITPQLQLPLPVIDLQSIPVAEQEQIVQQRAIAEFRHPFDLTADPLLRVRLLQLSKTDYVLLLTLHHIVADGWSIGVLIQELSTLYTAFRVNQPSPLPDLPIQYADFAHWQHQLLQGETSTSQLAYWQHQLANLPPLNLPSDRPRPPVPSYRGATRQLELSAELTASLEALSQQAGVTLFMTLLAAFQVVLSRYTGQDDIAVGSPIANRNLSEIEGLIGFFVNSLVLRTDLSGSPSFRDLLQRVQEMTLSAYAHQDLPFEKIVEALQPTRDLSRNPLFQVVFALQNTPIAPLKLPGVTLKLLNLEAGTTRFDLEFHCLKQGDQLQCTAIYSTDLFESATIERLLKHFQTLLQGIVADPDQQISRLPLLTPVETQQLLIEWNQTAAHDLSDTCFHQQFAVQAAQTPDAIALVYQNQQLTYRELNQRANQLAHRLQQLGVQPETLIGLCVDRSPDLIVSILGIWKAGAAYLPLDPDYPRDRLTFMLTDAQVSILITQSTAQHPFTGFSSQGSLQNSLQNSLQIICLDQDTTIESQSQLNPTRGVSINNLAYVIYTSGSTGKPKGVLVEHRGLSNLVAAQRQYFNVGAASRVLQFASLSFDASIFELVMALGNGATLYLAPQDALRPGADLLRLLQNQAITHATLPPAVLSVLPAAELPALHTLISAGEACSANLVDRWSQRRQFFNAYGPTETTIWATIAQLQQDSPITIGRPIANTQIYLLDAHQQPVPIGVIGELHIGGVGIARGYLNRPDLMRERFIPNPFADLNRPAPNLDRHSPLKIQPATRNPQPAILYRTGDLARYRPDGTLEFLGRLDDQVKIRGVRIEPGEIEAILKQQAGVQTAVVMVRQYAADQRLIAYVVPQPTQAMTTEGLRDSLRSRLPQSLMPSAFVLLEALPLTPNGKVNPAALPLPNLANPQRQATFIAPRSPLETTLAQIWATLLQIEPVSIRDNFFDLGGDSLLAAQLIEQVKQQLQQDIPLSTLFLAPTIEQLAQTLSPQPTPLPWSPLVPLQPNGSQSPFFCVHPVFGVVFPYCQLAHCLGSDHPFYGLQPVGLDGQQPYSRIEDMAAHYIQAIQRVQPQGPYLLGGWSFGGLVAFEMAQQLQRAGQPVALLAILDTLAPLPGNQPSLGDSLKFLVKTAMRSLMPFLLDYLALLRNPKQIWQVLTGRTALSTRKPLRGMAALLPQDSRLRVLNELTLRPMLRVFYANSRAVQRYKPQTCAVPITLFKTAAPSGQPLPVPDLGWSELTTAGVEVHPVPGNHFSMLRQPQVEALATQLRQCITQSLLRDRAHHRAN